MRQGKEAGRILESPERSVEPGHVLEERAMQRHGKWLAPRRDERGRNIAQEQRHPLATTSRGERRAPDDRVIDRRRKGTQDVFEESRVS